MGEVFGCFEVVGFYCVVDDVCSYCVDGNGGFEWWLFGG